jgi:two-component system phosphate regulon response regulator PhoB
VSDKLPPKILVIESDEVQNATLCNTIERYWFDVTRAKDADSAMRLAVVNTPNVAILSSRVQGSSAREMASKLRREKAMKDLPILFLLEAEEAQKNYVDANDNHSAAINRPFTPNELMTEIRALLRHSKPVFQDKIIKYNDISMDLSTYKVYRKQNQVHLGPTEFKILQLFVQQPKTIYSRRQIIDYVWGTDKDIAQRTIDVHINRIRTLMKLDTDQYQLIKTIRSSGYCLD